MQHLPTLVFRGDDQQLATEALIRSQRLLANPTEAELKSSGCCGLNRLDLETTNAEETLLFLCFFYLFWGLQMGMYTKISYFFARLSEIDHEHDGFHCDTHRRFEE